MVARPVKRELHSVYRTARYRKHHAVSGDLFDCNCISLRPLNYSNTRYLFFFHIESYWIVWNLTNYMQASSITCLIRWEGSCGSRQSSMLSKDNVTNTLRFAFRQRVLMAMRLKSPASSCHRIRKLQNRSFSFNRILEERPSSGSISVELPRRFGTANYFTSRLKMNSKQQL